MAYKICIVEDDEGIQDVLKIILKRAGYQTDIFSDGKTIMENGYCAPDLFLIDKQLPGTDGLTICQHLKDGGTTCTIPVVVMSAYPNVRELSVLAGANDFIEKPFRIEQLLATIRRHLPVAEQIPVSDIPEPKRLLL